MARGSVRRLLTLQMTLCFVLIFVRGSEEPDESYKNGRNLVLEYFLPINLPADAVDVALRREKRDVEEGSGEDEGVFSELRKTEDADNSTELAKLIGGEVEEGEKSVSLTNVEGSGEVSESYETSSEEESSEKGVAILAGADEPSIETTSTIPENRSEADTLTSTEMFFDKSEDFSAEETTTTEPTPTVILTIKETTNKPEETTTEASGTESTTPTIQETTTGKPETTTIAEETTTSTTTESITSVPQVEIQTTEAPDQPATDQQTTTKLPDLPTTTRLLEETTQPVVIPQILPEEAGKAVPDTTAFHPSTETMKPPSTVTSTPDFHPPVVVPNVTEGVPAPTKPPTTPQPVVEEVFQEAKVGKKLEAMPGNILQKENLSLAADPLLVANTRLMDSEETVQLSSTEPKRMGAYIVIGLILLSFSSLVGYITFRKRMNRKRQEFESHQESNDTEKALLSLSDYKDNSELEENHLKNNEITPIVVKSNSQINKFEKNTNFSSTKNLNMIANEKNIEKDNVLKSTAENLTQVIIEDSPKDVEEDKNVPNLEKLIVKTRIDQDSIPKKPIIINRSSAGYLPIPQDNS